MAYIISDECISCGACVASCPVDAIVEATAKYDIDKETCVDCGSCVEACPLSAISAE